MTEQVELRAGVITLDRRLDRIPHLDERNNKFKITAAIEPDKKLRSYTWSCPVRLDQGEDGACVGFGWAAELAARPSKIKRINNEYAKTKIYHPAQRIDPWEGGSYPGAEPQYEGTSVLAGAKVCCDLGFFEEYRWAKTVEELALGVGYKGPAVIGVNWHKGMFKPDKEGFIHPTGPIMGGHCVVILGVKIIRKEDGSIDYDLSYFLIQNSWGSDWGQDGRCKITLQAMQALEQDADFCLPLKRRLIEVAA